jgi:integrase/recombinase XerD
MAEVMTGLRASDRVALGALESALAQARSAADQRPAFSVIASSLSELGVAPAPPRPSLGFVETGRDDWLRRLRSGSRSDSLLRAYRNAIDDLLTWSAASTRAGELFEEATVVEYLDDYRRRCSPAPATYHRRFLLLCRFLRWLSARHGIPDPFLDLEPPPKPRQASDWLTPAEFARLLAAAGRPVRRRQGLAERDRLVLVALVTTGLRRAELLSLDWGDLDLDVEIPTLLVQRGKGGRPRRQPVAPQLAADLRALRSRRSPSASEPVFLGLSGRRLQPTTLALIIRRAAERAGIEKRVTAHTLRHTAATWLRQSTGDARLVAEFLGHADLSTVSRYAHVAVSELHEAAETLGAKAVAQGQDADTL